MPRPYSLTLSLCLLASISLCGVYPALAQTPAETPTPTADPPAAEPRAAATPTARTEASEPMAEELKQKRSGFALGLGLATRLPVVQIDGNTAAAAGSIAGSLFAGYKVNRVLFGLGFEINHIGATLELASQSGTATTKIDTTSFLFSPGVQIAVVRAASGRLELLAAAQVGLGRAVTKRSSDPPLPMSVAPEYEQTNFHLNYQIGPGLRFYFIPQLALSLISGVSGDHFFATQENPSGLRADSLASVSIFGNLGLLGVF